MVTRNVLSQASAVDTCGQRRGNSAYAWFLGCNNPERADDAAPGFDPGYQYASAIKLSCRSIRLFIIM